jgi:deoxycytidylate deaminase
MNNLPTGFRLARRMAQESTEEHRLGACLVKSGRVLGKGKNSVNKTNWLAKQAFNYPTIHAEMSALFRLSENDMRGSILYVYRERKSGLPGLAKPCDRCSQILSAYGIKRVCYTTNEYPYFAIWEPKTFMLNAA